MVLTVIHVDGSKKGQTETFDQALVAIGRDPANQLVFDPYKDQDVSAKHAQFVVQGGSLMIQDMKSRNGTFVNGARVGDQPFPVPDGAVVQFGDKGPKIQISFRVVPTGPGKKTQMIVDLEGRMKQQAASSSRRMLSAIFGMGFLAAAAGGGFMALQKWQKHKGDQALVSDAMANVPGARKAAEEARAPELAPEAWKTAQELVEKAEAARKAGKLDEASTHFAAALGAYRNAKDVAEKAELKGQISKLNEELQKKTQEKQQQQVQEDKTREKELEAQKADADRKAQEQIDKLKKELEATKSAAEIAPLVDAALASSKIAQVESVLEKVKQKAAESPSDQLTKWQDQLGKRLEDLKSVGPRLDKAAQEIKARVVAIQATSYMLPKAQTEKTTQIREFLTTASGTGFFVGKDKVATAKELVEPWKFDPAALALKKKWDEYGYKVATKIDVLVLNADGIYAVAATNNPEVENPTVSVVYQGADAFQDEAIDQKVSFKGAESAVKVQPHKRDASNVAVIQIKGQSQNPIPLAEKDDSVKAGDPAIALGQKVGGPEVKSPDQARLYSQQAELKQVGLLGVGGFATWTGGPVLDPNGQVAGLIV
ncbi:MAG: FHA domain-containing protein [Planctomycetota bacterium]